MRRHLQSMTPLLWVVALALLAVRMADAHVHVCFDGQEPRSRIHVSDPAPFCHESDGTHRDQDMDAQGAVLAKKSAGADTLGPLPVADLVLFLLPLQRGSTDHELTTQNPSPKLPELFLPLLRGPPV